VVAKLKENPELMGKVTCDIVLAAVEAGDVNPADANKYLIKHDVQLIDNQTAYAIAGDWTDTADLFSNQGRSDQRGWVEKVFSGDADFWSDYTPELKDLWDWISKENWEKIRNIAVEYGFDPQTDNNALKEFIDEGDELEDAIRRAGSDAEESGLAGAWYETLTNAVEKKMSSKTHWVNDKLAFIVSVSDLRRWTSSTEEGYDEPQNLDWGVIMAGVVADDGYATHRDDVYGDFTENDLGLWHTLSSAYQQKILAYYRNIGVVPDR